jgi:uncharacterized protein
MDKMKSSKSWRGIAGLCLLGLVSAAGTQCQALDRGKDKFVRVFLPDGRSVVAELAVTDEERARGLMFRDKLLADQGMLFVFDAEEPHAFWMKNTLIPLDMLWLGGDKRVIHIEKNVPPCPADPCPSYGPDTPARFVLELIGGSADARGLKIGDRLDFVLPQWAGNATERP